MKSFSERRTLLAVLFSLGISVSVTGQETDGFKSIFDGQSLTGWESPDMTYWSVEDGSIVGRITREHPCTVNQYLVLRQGELADFELKLKSRLNGEGGINNGFQFRSRLLPDHDICGYQMDNNLQTPWLVRLYEEFGRHTLAMRGERTIFDAKGARTTTKIDETAAQAWFRLEDWHEYHLKCVGPKITLWVNDQLAAEVEDNDPRRQAFQGVLGLQLHSGPPTVVQFKDIRLKIFKPAQKIVEPRVTDWQKKRRTILDKAAAWWPLDAGAHGASPPLRHIPGWEHFELNRRADGPGSIPGTRVILLDGAYFEGNTRLKLPEQQLTIYLRGRDPSGKWDAALFNKQAGNEGTEFNLFAADFAKGMAEEIAFEAETEKGRTQVSFPISRIEATAWHDFIGRYDGKTLALFCNGTLMASKPCDGNLVNNDGHIFIGAENRSGKIVRHFRGELEEAAVWPAALDDNEISLVSRHK